MSREMRVSATDRKLFSRTVEAAYFGEHERVRVGAILARGRTALRVRHNVVRSGIDGPDKPSHAERRAIDGQPAIKGTLYVCRLDLGSKLAASWPCGECMLYIKACACVSKIVYFDGEKLRKVRI